MPNRWDDDPRWDIFLGLKEVNKKSPLGLPAQCQQQDLVRKSHYVLNLQVPDCASDGWVRLGEGCKTWDGHNTMDSWKSVLTGAKEPTYWGEPPRRVLCFFAYDHALGVGFS